MTIEQIKQEIAEKYGFTDWNVGIILFSSKETLRNAIDEAIELYAAQFRPIKLTKDNIPKEEVLCFNKSGDTFVGTIDYFGAEDNEFYCLIVDYEEGDRITYGITHFMHKP